MNIDYTHTLHDIADRLERLAPSHRDPFRFHEEKSELVAELRRLANSGKTLPTIPQGRGRPQQFAAEIASGGKSFSTRITANDNQPRLRTATSCGGATTGLRAARQQE